VLPTRSIISLDNVLERHDINALLNMTSIFSSFTRHANVRHVRIVLAMPTERLRMPAPLCLGSMLVISRKDCSFLFPGQ
jgi:hypothetical protein